VRLSFGCVLLSPCRTARRLDSLSGLFAHVANPFGTLAAPPIRPRSTARSDFSDFSIKRLVQLIAIELSRLRQPRPRRLGAAKLLGNWPRPAERQVQTAMAGDLSSWDEDVLFVHGTRGLAEGPRFGTSAEVSAHPTGTLNDYRLKAGVLSGP
jgi:hypothetical protein